MKNALLLALAGVLTVALVVVGTTFLLPKGNRAENETVSSQENTSLQSSSQLEPYLLRTYEGKLAVFTTDYVTPDYVFEVYVKTLPVQDQESLARGIRAPDYETLARMVEDYIS